MSRPSPALVLALVAPLTLSLAACAEEAADGAPDVASSTADSAPDVAPDTGPIADPLPEVLGHPVAVDLDPDPRVVAVELTAGLIEREIAGVPLTLYAYNGVVPGPLIQARVGDEVVVRFKNELPEATTIHWHGLRISDLMDGSPRMQAPVEPGGTFEYRFTVPDAGSFWYHPHVRGNEQIEKGLQGPLVVHEADDPAIDADRFVVLDDMLLADDGMPPFLSGHMELMHGRTGNVLLTDGVAEALSMTSAVGRVERWRLVNTANARTMTLSIEGAAWRVVGTDGGLITAPYAPARLEVAVGQRYDLEVTFAAEGTARLLSHVLTLDDDNEVEELAIPVVEVAVEPSDAAPTVASWPAVAPLPVREPGRYLTVVLAARSGAGGELEWNINGHAHSDHWLFQATQGDTLAIIYSNTAGPEHPFHLHGQFFEIVARDGVPVTDEPGLKDTVLVHGMEQVEIKAYLDNPGQWMAHCHILEHMELGMMADFEVAPASE